MPSVSHSRLWGSGSKIAFLAFLGAELQRQWPAAVVTVIFATSWILNRRSLLIPLDSVLAIPWAVIAYFLGIVPLVAVSGMTMPAVRGSNRLASSFAAALGERRWERIGLVFLIQLALGIVIPSILVSGFSDSKGNVVGKMSFAAVVLFPIYASSSVHAGTFFQSGGLMIRYAKSLILCVVHAVVFFIGVIYFGEFRQPNPSVTCPAFGFSSHAPGTADDPAPLERQNLWISDLSHEDLDNSQLFALFFLLQYLGFGMMCSCFASDNQVRLGRVRQGIVSKWRWVGRQVGQVGIVWGVSLFSAGMASAGAYLGEVLHVCDPSCSEKLAMLFLRSFPPLSLSQWVVRATTGCSP